ncbi:MAG: response regulator [Victivallales bacterium]|nr:response regulator [Victivallales bacterium]
MDNRHILVIDDQKDLRERLAQFISSSGKKKETDKILDNIRGRLGADEDPGQAPHGRQEVYYDVDSAASGEEGLQMILKAIELGTPYALVFLDVRMPTGWDGLHTLDKILSADSKTQIVICTAYSDFSWEEILERVGIRDNLLILKKPFENMEIAQLALALTEKYNSEERIRQTQKMDTIGNLAAGLAHDFNNIIGSIQATLSSIEFTIATSKDLQSAKIDLGSDIGTLKTAAKQGAEMVEILLSLSRRQDLPLAKVDLNKVVENVVRICKRTLDKSVSIRFIPLENKATAEAYSVQMEQVLLNLCINAAHAMTLMRPEDHKKGGLLKIEIQDIRVGENMLSAIPDAKEGDYRVISIEDDGVGIPKSIISKIFDPFFTTKSEGQGSGLGLSMVYSIVRKHKGFLELFSEPGKGTTFFIFLPAVKA